MKKRSTNSKPANLDNLLTDLRDDYLQDDVSQVVIDNIEPKEGKEVRMRRRAPRWALFLLVGVIFVSLTAVITFTKLQQSTTVASNSAANELLNEATDFVEEELIPLPEATLFPTPEFSFIAEEIVPVEYPVTESTPFPDPPTPTPEPLP